MTTPTLSTHKYLASFPNAGPADDSLDSSRVHGVGIVGVAGLSVLGAAALMARWQYYGPERRTNPTAFAVMVGGAVLAATALLILWVGHC